MSKLVKWTDVLPDGDISFETRGTDNERDIIREIFVENVYRVTESDLDGSKVVVDIGANIGVFSVFAANLIPNTEDEPGAAVYAVEPDPDNFALLKKNTEKYGNVGVCGMAITDEIGKTTITKEAGGSKLGKFADDDTDRTSVPSTNLKGLYDTVLGVDQVDVLKIDAERSEEAIILGAPADVLKRTRYITIEFHDGIDVGKLITKLMETHAVQTLGKPNAGGMLYARRY